MPVSEAQKKATTRFEHNTYDKITVRLRKDDPKLTRDSITKFAEANGQSLNSFIIDAIKTKMNI